MAEVKVAIIYGWAEGSWQSRLFTDELTKRGLVLTKNVGEADVIIAHSSGCYLIPHDITAKLILLIGLPHWPGRSVASGIIHKLMAEMKHHRRDRSLAWWLNKLAHNIWYIVTRPQATYYGLTRHKPENLPDAKNRKVLLVRP